MEGKETESTSVSLSIISACCSFSPSSQGGYGAGNLVLFENSDKEILSPHVNWNIRKVIHIKVLVNDEIIHTTVYCIKTYIHLQAWN